MIEIKTGKEEFDGLWPLVKGFLEADVREIEHWGKTVRGYRSPDCPYIWFRDHIHMMEATVYLEADIKNAVSFMLEMQNEDGHFMDYIAPDGEMQRIPTEADVEYLAVIGVYRAWQASGDDEWMEKCIPALERGLQYCTSHPWRWDPIHQMIKRAYTIDTWDFDYRDDLQEIHWPGKIDDKTHFGLMHGDTSGLYYAWRLMARMLRHLGKDTDAVSFELKASDLRTRANELLFNGRFYRHRFPLDDVLIPGADEERQLSLSNAYNLNRGLPTEEMANRIIIEYRLRSEWGTSFAEWYSIDPPFPKGVFGSDKLVPGAYVNGGIMPLVGGELARGSFRHGFSAYGCDILRRYYNMIKESGESYLWYFPDGRAPTAEESTSPESLPTDGWGSSAMLAALVEGLAGVNDNGSGFSDVTVSPRWIAAGVDEASVRVPYAASGKVFSYVFKHDPDKKSIVLDLQDGKASMIEIVVPETAVSAKISVDGNELECHSIRKGNDRVFELKTNNGGAKNIKLYY